ncbi:HugZ family protein [Ochrobactrum sp. Q0168]|uniref:HugZ family pyridoxamine 5'-phosphate oxidase n=1 Tax=Ochrobactrum sp. Q0168 TaxID=2793241 RepID=UPI0018EBC6A6|nr:HugZ family protein [Ochrobactrum sp. Q0168]
MNQTEEPIDSPIRPTTPEAIQLAKTLMRTARYGALAVLDAKTGRPLASRVAVATDMDGTPLILISGLAAHTPGLLANPACSLLLGEPGKGDPLAHPRITLHCDAAKVKRTAGDYPRIRRRYLNHNPKGALYVDLGDFAFFRMNVLGASLNGGFGKAFILVTEDLICPATIAESLAPKEQGILDSIKEDGEDSLAARVSQMTGIADRPLKAVGLDPDGLDIAAGNEILRLPFSRSCASATEVRAELLKMTPSAH